MSSPKDLPLTLLLQAERPLTSKGHSSQRGNCACWWIAPSHCTGKPAFAILKQRFGDRYVYAGLGSTLILGPTIKTAKAGQPPVRAMDEEDMRGYRKLLALGHDNRDRLLAHREHVLLGSVAETD